MSKAPGNWKRLAQAILGVISVLGIATVVVRMGVKEGTVSRTNDQSATAEVSFAPMVDVSAIPRSVSVDAEEISTGNLEALLASLPSKPLEQRAEILQHLVNLVEDEQYAPMGRLAQDVTTPRALLEILIADLMNRGDLVKLPVLEAIAATPAHPYQDLAADVLEVYEPHVVATAE